MNMQRLRFLMTVALVAIVCRGSTRAQDVGGGKPSADAARAWEAAKAVALPATQAIDKSQQTLEEIDRIISQENVPLNIALASAEAAFLLGAPSKAISIMERATRQYPTEKPPVVIYPLSIIGKFWIGTFARHAGDATRAEAAYRDILSELKAKPEVKGASVLAAMCYLYLAEIETHFRNRPDKAVALLRELAALPRPKQRSYDKMFGMYLCWGQYLLRANGSLAHPDSSVPTVPEPPCQDWGYSPMIHGVLIGLCDAGGLAIFCDNAGTPFFSRSLQMVIESRASPIDACLAQFLLGYELERKKKPAMARKYYNKLFEGNSFFAPSGGIAMARCLKDEGKPEESKRALQEVARRFPAHKDLAERLQREWFGGTQSQ